LSVQLHTFSSDDRTSRQAPRRRRCCQVAGCGRPFSRPVEIQLPAAWEAGRRYTVLITRVDACCDHAEELERRAGVLLEARDVVGILLTIVEAAAVADAGQREQIAGAERALRMARGAGR
jgi:hypothetical protein